MEFRIVGQAVYGDARYYLAFTRSIYFSQNLDISDEMNHHWAPDTNNKPSGSSPVERFKHRASETAFNFSLGSSIIWLPIFLIADLVVVLGFHSGLDLVRNGYSDVYQIVLGTGNILFVVAGLFFLFKILNKYFSEKISYLSTALILFATNLFYYGGLDVINSHPFSFFGSSLLLFLFFRARKTKDIKLLFLQGLILGLMISNRFQDLFFVLIPAATILFGLKLKLAEFLKHIKPILAGVLGLVIGYLPQLLILLITQDRLILIPHIGKTQSEFFPFIHSLSLLSDPKLGIVIYMPLILIAFAGLFLFRKKEKFLGTLFLLIVGANFFLISSYHSWNAAGYTMRYFISSLPFLAFGLAEIIKRVEKRTSFQVVLVLAGIFIIHQAFAILYFKLFMQDPTFINGQLTRSGQLKEQILNLIVGK